MDAAPRPDETLRPALEALAARDADIARHYAHCGLPPERGQPAGFAGLARIIAAQQVSAAAAAAIIGRPESALRPCTPEGFLELDEAALRAIGLSRPKMRYCRALAEHWRPHRSAAARFMWHCYRHPGLPESEVPATQENRTVRKRHA